MKYYNNFFKFADKYNKLILTSHENPDADAIASEYALCKYLVSNSYNAVILTCETVPEKYKFIDHENIIQYISSEDEIPVDADQSALVVLDTNTPYNTGSIYKMLSEKINDIFIIDHHEKEMSAEYFLETDNINCIETDASSTCEIIYNIIKSRGGTLDIYTAQAIFAGILYDTGSFVYPKTGYKTLKIASDLVKIGVNPNYVYSCMYETNTLSSLKLQSRVFSDIEFYHNNKIALQIMTRNILESFNANYEDGDSIINLPLKCRDILVSVFFKENHKGVMRCSLRSKDNIDVASIAKMFGGGGHTTAAGFKCCESLEIIKEKVIQEIINILT